MISAFERLFGEFERMFSAIESLGTRRLALLAVLTWEILAAEVLVMPL
ncbi:hypothetical protein [Mycolicibacterium nivoides]